MLPYAVDDIDSVKPNITIEESIRGAIRDFFEGSKISEEDLTEAIEIGLSLLNGEIGKIKGLDTIMEIRDKIMACNSDSLKLKQLAPEVFQPIIGQRFVHQTSEKMIDTDGLLKISPESIAGARLQVFTYLLRMTIKPKHWEGVKGYFGKMAHSVLSRVSK